MVTYTCGWCHKGDIASAAFKTWPGWCIKERCLEEIPLKLRLTQVKSSPGKGQNPRQKELACAKALRWKQFWQAPGTESTQ